MAIYWLQNHFIIYRQHWLHTLMGITSISHFDTTLECTVSGLMAIRNVNFLKGLHIHMTQETTLFPGYVFLYIIK